MKEIKIKYNREYLGVTITQENYRDILNKEGRDAINFHNKHLKAYLQGKKEFGHKYKRDSEGKVMYDMLRRPLYNMHQVLQSVTIVE